MRIKNFLFHRVSDEADAMWPPMKPDLFKRIIHHLTKNYQVVPLERYLQDPGEFRSKKPVATVLFDDGYKDNIEYAAPILRSFECPASFYVVTDCINRNIPTWTFIIDHLFQQTRISKLELQDDFVPPGMRSVDLSGGSGNKRKVKPWMKGLSNSQRLKIMEQIQEQCKDVPVSRSKMMNWDEVRQLDSGGFIIGSHSHTHPMLASLEDTREIAEELQFSKETILKEVGKRAETISYPIGSYDERVIRVAKESGYKYGLAVKQQFFEIKPGDVWEIPRVELYQEPWWKQRMRISGMYARLKKIWQ